MTFKKWGESCPSLNLNDSPHGKTSFDNRTPKGCLEERVWGEGWKEEMGEMLPP